MASVTLDRDVIDIRFTGWERMWVGRERFALRLSAVRHAAPVDEPIRLARGARRGYTVSGFAKVGVWGIFGGPRQLVAARRGQPGLHLVLDRAAAGGEFDEVIVSDPAASRLAETIGRATRNRP